MTSHQIIKEQKEEEEDQEVETNPSHHVPISIPHSKDWSIIGSTTDVANTTTPSSFSIPAPAWQETVDILLQRINTDLQQYKDVTKLVCTILTKWGHDWKDRIEYKSFFNSKNKTTTYLVHETEECIVALHYLREWWLTRSSTSQSTTSSTSTSPTVDDDNDDDHDDDNTNDDDEFIAVDLCCGKGYFSMYLKYLADEYWNNPKEEEENENEESVENNSSSSSHSSNKRRRRSRRRRLKKIILMDKDTNINFDHIYAANNDSNGSEHCDCNNKVKFEVWSGCNLNDTRAILTKLEKQSLPVAITGIHLCRMLSPSFLSVTNGLRSMKLCPYICLAPCCLPRCVSKGSNKSIKISIHRNATTIKEGSAKRGGGGGKKRKRERRPCYLCSKTTHLVKDCPLLPKDNPKEVSRIRQEAAKTIPCWNCGIVGHFQNECPMTKKTADQDEKVSKESNSSHSNSNSNNRMIQLDTSNVMKSKNPFNSYCHVLASQGISHDGTCTFITSSNGSNNDGNNDNNDSNSNHIERNLLTKVIDAGFKNNKIDLNSKDHQGNWNGVRKSIYIVSYYSASTVSTSNSSVGGSGGSGG